MTTATLHTTMGDIVVELFPDHAPKTVANFVELATGARNGLTHALAKNQLPIFTTAPFFTASLMVS